MWHWLWSWASGGGDQNEENLVKCSPHYLVSEKWENAQSVL